MSKLIQLTADDVVESRAFTHPDHSQTDLLRMQAMAQQLVDTYDDPAVCDFEPGKKPICQSDPQGRHFRIYYIQPKLLFSLKDLTVVGFFGHKRPGADIRPLIRADKQFEPEFQNHPGLLSLSTVRLPDGDYGNLVLFTDPESKDQWNNTPLHRDLVAKISSPYYADIRLNNAVLPEGLADPENMEMIRVRYLDFTGKDPWMAVRTF